MVFFFFFGFCVCVCVFPHLEKQSFLVVLLQVFPQQLVSSSWKLFFGSGTELVHHVTCIQPRGRAFYGALQVRRSEDLHGSNVPVTVGSEKILSRGSFFSWTVTRGLIPGLSMELRSAICFFFFLIGIPKIMPHYFNSY